MTCDDTSVVSEAMLHAAWQAGDPKAAAQLITRYRSRLRALGERLGLSKADAEDLAQEVLLDAPCSRFVARIGSSYWSWLSVIARRKTARMFARRAAELAVRRCTTPWSGTCRRQLLETIDVMPEPNRDVFVRLVAEYEVTDIADELGLERAAVRMRIHRGRKWLRDRGY